MSIKISINKPLPAAFLLSTLFFLYIAIYKLEAPAVDLGLLSGFLSATDLFFRNNPAAFGFFILVLAVVALRKPKEIFPAVISTGLVMLAASFASLVLAVIIVYLNLWLFAFRTGSSSGPAGLIWNRQEINNVLLNSDKPPVIETIDKGRVPERMIAEYFNNWRTGTFFKQYIMQKIPGTIIPVNIPDSQIYLINGKLIFTGMNPNDLTELSPVLGYLLVKNYFGTRLMKTDAKVSILNRQDYLKLREDQIGKQLSDIDTYSSRVIKLYNDAQKTINNDQAGIKDSQNGLDKSTNSYQLELNNCQAAGYNDVFVNKFIRYHDDAYCLDKAKLDWGEKIDTYRQDITSLTIKLASDQKSLDSAGYIKTVVENYRSAVASQMNSAPDELGLFHDQNKIELVLDYINARSVPAYLQSLVHEYLHYDSFISDQRILPRSFEEGLTEYYAREVMKKDLGQDMVLGYPLLVKIIRQMAIKVPADQLQTVYFNKDEALLSKLLDLYFGANFYEENSVQFEILPLLPPDKAVEIGNTLMGKIGGPQITNDDLYSDISRKD